jgi:hypothetical protein
MSSMEWSASSFGLGALSAAWCCDLIWYMLLHVLCVQGLAAGRGCSLRNVEMGANPCCQEDNFVACVRDVEDARPDLRVHWRANLGSETTMH